MKAAAIFLVLAVLVSAVFAGSDLTGTISGGIFIDTSAGNVTNGGNSVDFRAVTFGAVLDFAYYVSVEVTEQSNGNTAEADVDAVGGFLIVPTLVSPVPPTAIVMYFHAEADASGLSGGLGSFSGTASGSVAGTVYLSVEEVDASGSVVATYDLSGIDMGSPTASTKDYVHSAVWTGSKSGHFSISFAGIASEIAGFLSVGGAAITPKSVEVVIELDNIVYASTGNHMRLNVLTLAASADETFQASTSTLVSGSGDSQMYVHFAGQAVINGETVQDVTVTGVDVHGTGSAHDASNSLVSAMVTANASLHVDFRKVSIDFPADATSISYDPAMGFDAAIYSAASALVAPVALIFFCAFFLLFL